MKARPGACAPGFVNGKKKGFALRPFFRWKPAPPPGTLRWARFLPDEKSGKESPKAGPSPALWNPPRGTGCPCVLLFSALGRVGSHGWHGSSTEYTCFCGNLYFYRRGLTRVSRCSQLSAAGTPLLRGEALEGEAPSHREGGASHRLARLSM